jgi:hypothetical protein
MPKSEKFDKQSQAELLFAGVVEALGPLTMQQILDDADESVRTSGNRLEGVSYAMSDDDETDDFSVGLVVTPDTVTFMPIKSITDRPDLEPYEITRELAHTLIADAIKHSQEGQKPYNKQ